MSFDLSDWKQRELKQWQAGCTTVDSVKHEITYYTRERARFNQRLEALRQYVSEYPPGTDEGSEWRVKQLEGEVQWYDNTIAFYEWLELQPRNQG